MKKIGIIGSGIVAQSLGAGFIKHGYEVLLGSRDISKLEEWKANSGERAFLGSFEDAALFGEIVVLAVKGQHAVEAIQLAGAHHLKSKLVIDTCNPIDESRAPKDGVLHFFTSLDESLLEILQRSYPEIWFVKGFNSVGSAFMANPSFEGGKPGMFICGDNETAKAQVKEILDQFGWESEDMGSSTAARAIEPLCMLWCIPGFRNNQWAHAFKLLKM